jgi:probable rRNA maturation factor
VDIQIDRGPFEAALEGIPLHGLACFILEKQGVPPDAELSVSFVTDEAMADLNGRFRGKEGPTDVLAFECDGSEDKVFATGGVSLGQEGEAWPPDGLEDQPPQPVAGDDPLPAPAFLLGDVVIAPDVAQRQSLEYGTSLEEELSLLLVHGILHLCGYDHQEDEEAEAMEARESCLLDAWEAIRKPGESHG